MLTFLILPVLTYVASMLNTAGTNSLLLLVVFLIAALALVLSLPGNRISEKLYPLAIGTFSFCLLFHVQWISPSLVGSDVTVEYFVFELVRSLGQWNPYYSNPYNSALSVTILPTMVQSVLAADDITTFKTLYPLAFSLVPVILYLAYKNVIGSKRAFVSSLFFMSFTTYFYGVSFIGKQEIAEVILASLILLTVRSRLQAKSSGRSFAMIILITGLVASHYSTAYIYLSFLLLSSLAVLKKKSVMSLSLVSLSVVIAAGWYMFTAGGSALSALAQFGTNVFGTMTSGFFNPQSRGTEVLEFFGEGVTPSFVNSINLLVQYTIQLFIVVGVIGLLKQRKSENVEFLCYSVIALFLVVLSVVLPSFANGLNMTRIYQIALMFLSPACVLGGESFFRTLLRASFALTNRSWHVSLWKSDRALTFAASVIILFLLFNTGFLNEITGAPPLVVPLGINRIREGNNQVKLVSLYGIYTPEQDFISVRWLSTYMILNSSICGDLFSRFQLLDYAGIPLPPLEGANGLIPVRSWGYGPNCMYFLFHYLNVVYGIGSGLSGDRVIWSTSEITNVVSDRNRIYSNGGSNILA